MNHTDKCIDLLSGRKNESKPLAQIAEMEKAQKPLTWNERINQMTVDEKAKWLYDLDVCRVSSISIDECNSYRHCTECMRNMLNSPYTEGEKHEG